MNKVINANLAGLAFTFDQEAYAQLDDYLARLQEHFAHTPGCTEIMADIEGRLAELFAQGLKGRTIVSTADVRAAVATLGQPEALGAEADTDYDGDYADASYADERDGGRYADTRRGRGRYRDSGYGYSRYGRRLMRDGDDKILAGVCSGLSAYFGIDNPVWLRLAFATAVLGAGIGVVPYLVLWIVMPVARTPKDRLAMRGEPIDLAHLTAQVEHEAREFGDQVRDWTDDFRRDRPWERNGKRGSTWRQPFANFGSGARTERPPRNSDEFRRRHRDEGYMV